MTNATCSVRVIVYHDKQCNGGNATAALLLSSAAAVDYLSFRNLDNTERFRTLMDKMHNMTSSGAAGDGTTNDFVGISRSYSFNKSCNIPILYDASTGAVTDLVSSNIGILVIAENTNAKFTAQARVRYTDK